MPFCLLLDWFTALILLLFHTCSNPQCLSLTVNTKLSRFCEASRCKLSSHNRPHRTCLVESRTKRGDDGSAQTTHVAPNNPIQKIGRLNRFYAFAAAATPQIDGSVSCILRWLRGACRDSEHSAISAWHAVNMQKSWTRCATPRPSTQWNKESIQTSNLLTGSRVQMELLDACCSVAATKRRSFTCDSIRFQVLVFMRIILRNKHRFLLQ